MTSVISVCIIYPDQCNDEQNHYTVVKVDGEPLPKGGDDLRGHGKPQSCVRVAPSTFTRV